MVRWFPNCLLPTALIPLESAAFRTSYAKMDDEYRLYVATAAGIQMFDPTGRLGGSILKPEFNKPVSNIVFGGAKFDYLYATCGDNVFRRHVKPTGRPDFVRNAK